MTIVQWCQRVILPAVLLGLAGCGTLADDGPVINSWSPAPLVRQEAPKAQTGGAGTASSPAEAARPQATHVRGSGRFIGEAPARTEDPTATTGDGVTLNLVNVPVVEAAKTVLDDILAVQYTVDAGVEGTITIQTPRPITRGVMIELFQAALKANGAAVVRTSGVYRIVPADQAPASARLKTGGPTHGEPLASNLRVVQLRYVAAADMQRILEPISPGGAVVQADGARNTITLSGHPGEIAAMLETIAVFDVDVMAGKSFALVPVASSKPEPLAEELTKVFATEEDGPMAGMVRFLPNERLGAVLIISPQPRYLARAEAWTRRLDAQAGNTEKRFYTYRVQNRQASEIVDVLQAMFSGEIKAARPREATRQVTPSARESTLNSVSTNGTSSRPFGGLTRTATQDTDASSQDNDTSAYTTADAGDNGQAEPPVRVVADSAKNALLIEATPADYARVMKVVETLDVMPNQVLIEATIAEVTLTDELAFGLRWYLDGKSSDFIFTDAASGSIASVFPGFSYALRAANIATTLNTLNDITDVNVVSSPTLTVVDNKTATLQIGDQVPITTQSSVSVNDPDAPIVNSVSYRDTGVILAITPRINDSGRVLLDIEQEVSSVAETRSSGIDSPTIRQRRVKTSVMVNDGEALALGGLIQTTRSRGRTQVPILGDLPVIGNAFQQRNNDVAKTELVILITPHVMRDLEEARRITDEFRTQFERQVRRDRDRSRAIPHTVRRIVE